MSEHNAVEERIVRSMGDFNPPMAKPEWVKEAIKDTQLSLKLLASGDVPEDIRGFCLRTAALRLLRCVYGSDRNTVEALMRHVFKLGGEKQ
jgi:hypothetical protein